jgi:1-acyl-sn-glycerol-3-phosphate acyltransferase
LFYRLTVWLIWLLSRLFYRNKIIWEVAPSELPSSCIIAPNHASYLDPPLVAASWPSALDFFAGSHLFEKTFLRTVLPHLHCHPVTKGQELATIRLAIDLLLQGKSIVLFPEGTRSGGGDILPLREGVALLSIRSKRPVVPCYLKGTYDAWPRSKAIPKFFGMRTLCHFGRPVFPADYTTKQEMTAAIQAELDRLVRLHTC